jgi:hypothetical protein
VKQQQWFSASDTLLAAQFCPFAGTPGMVAWGQHIVINTSLTTNPCTARASGKQMWLLPTHATTQTRK